MTKKSMPQNVVVVGGRGTVEVSPDLAILHVSLEADADSAAEALRIVSETSTAVLSAVRAHDVAGEDVATTTLSVFPQMDESRLRIHHYRGSYGLRVRIRQMSQAPAIIEAISAAGDAFRLGGLQMVVSDPRTAQAEAGVMAVRDARQRAAQIAEAADVRLGRVLSIVEGVEGGEPAGRRPRLLRAAAQFAGGPSIEGGTEEVNVEVTVTFEIAH